MGRENKREGTWLGRQTVRCEGERNGQMGGQTGDGQVDRERAVDEPKGDAYHSENFKEPLLRGKWEPQAGIS